MLWTKNYFYNNQLNFVKMCVPYNGTKEANVLVIIIWWQGYYTICTIFVYPFIEA